MSAPLSPKTMEAVRNLPSMQELAKNRPDVPTEKPKVQKTVEELEQARSELELACQSFAGKDGKGGTIFELTELLKTDEKEEAELIELMGANADLEKALEPARKAREEDRKQIERLKQAYDSLLVEIAQLNKQIREAREAQVKEGKKEVEKEAAEVEDLTEHAVLEPPPIPFAVRDASIAKHQADLAAAPDLTEHAILQPPPIPEEVRKASREAIPDLSEYVVAMDPPPISEEIRTKSVEQHQRRMMKQTQEKTPAEAAPAKPEPAAKNEAGPETIAEAQAFLAEDQREQLEVRQRLLKLYHIYKEVVLPQTQALSEAAQALGSLGGPEKAGPVASLQLGAKMQLDDTRTLLPLLVGLQSEAMRNTPQDIEARTRDVQMVTARLQMRMVGIQGFRNTVLGLRAGVPKGSTQEGALVSLDGVAGKAWKSLGGMAAEWQPIGAKVQARNGREYHKLYKQAYGVITSERAKGNDIKIEVPKDVQEAMPKEVIPETENIPRMSI